MISKEQAARLLNANLRVLILDTDYYAREAINGLLAWDRRTRVVHLANTLESARQYVTEHDPSEWPDVVLLDAAAARTPAELAGLVDQIERTIRNVTTLVLDRRCDLDTAYAIADAEVNGYLLRDEVQVTLAWMICWAQLHNFVTTPAVKRVLSNGDFCPRRLFDAVALPPRRPHSDIPARTRQALELFVIKGMAAPVVADEMDIKTSTVRDYIRKGYRALEDSDPFPPELYPKDISSQELAFMRLTALDLGDIDR